MEMGGINDVFFANYIEYYAVLKTIAFQYIFVDVCGIFHYFATTIDTGV